MKNKRKANPHNRDETLKKERDYAVSPVVGVMLMLVVTIIIAAVVSGFSGGIMGGSDQNAPSLSMDVKIANSGTAKGSEISMDVTGVSEPIPTRDLKIVTSWTTTVKNNYYLNDDQNCKKRVCSYPSGAHINSTGGAILTLPIGSVYHGGAEVLPGIANAYSMKVAKSVAPYGFGAAVDNTSTSAQSNDPSGADNTLFNWPSFTSTHFGNYSLDAGTVMMAEAGGRCVWYPKLGGGTDSYTQGGYGSNTYTSAKNAADLGVSKGYIPHPYTYKTGGVFTVYQGTKTTPTDIVADGGNMDGMQAILGIGWENLRAGDVVNLKVIHTPSGKTIFTEDIIVSSTS